MLNQGQIGQISVRRILPQQRERIENQIGNGEINAPRRIRVRVGVFQETERDGFQVVAVGVSPSKGENIPRKHAKRISPGNEKNRAEDSHQKGKSDDRGEEENPQEEFFRSFALEKYPRLLHTETL